MALLNREKKPFATAQFFVLQPGEYHLRLGKGRSARESFGESFHFKFTGPTEFSATLVHAGSTNMMMAFMGEGSGLHFTREDARAGELLAISCQITAADLKAIGNRYWSLEVTNFDRENPATCTLHVYYENKQKQDEE